MVVLAGDCDLARVHNISIVNDTFCGNGTAQWDAGLVADHNLYWETGDPPLIDIVTGGFLP